MSVPKKSLISNRMAVKKAIIANAPADGAQFAASGSLKSTGVSALSMKKKKVFAQKALRVSFAKKS